METEAEIIAALAVVSDCLTDPTWGAQQWLIRRTLMQAEAAVQRLSRAGTQEGRLEPMAGMRLTTEYTELQ